MKSIIGPVVIAIALGLAGGAFWLAGQTERRLAEIHQQIAMNKGATTDFIQILLNTIDTMDTKDTKKTMETKGRPYIMLSPA